MVSLTSFKQTPYQVGSLVTPPEQGYGGTDPHHRLRKKNYYGHVALPSNFPGISKITIGPGSDTVYLPFFTDQVASVHLPTDGPFFFVTDNMSGCAFSIAQYADGSLVVFHANSQLGSDKATMESARPNHQVTGATNRLQTLITDAKRHHGGARIVRTLMKSEYLGALGNTVREGKDFLGGTTIAGWRTGANWEFWFQNWGSIQGSPPGLLYVKQFYP
jgi:hypothetical protein